MNEPQVVEVMQSSDHLKQYLIEVPMVTVLPEIHRVPINLKIERVEAKKHSLKSNNVFALMFIRQRKNLILIIELLSQSILLLKALVTPNSEDNIIPYLSFIKID